MKFQYKKTLLYTLMMCSTAIVMAAKSFPSDQKALESSDPLEHSKPRQWSEIYNVTETNNPNAIKGRQILHFDPNKYRPYQENQYARDFVEKYCLNAKQFETDAEVLHFALDQVTLDGDILEMGTGAAKTTNFLADLDKDRIIHTFDSYKGLPEDWIKEDEKRIIPKGYFALRDPNSKFLPTVPKNVNIHLGEFSESLPKHKKDLLKDNPIPFINIDCDIYSSTKTVFNILGDNIVPGTILHFDEFYNYPNYLQGEFKAFQEFVHRKG